MFMFRKFFIVTLVMYTLIVNVSGNLQRVTTTNADTAPELVFHLTGDAIDAPELINGYKVEYENVTITEGRIGKALLFNGTDSYVKIKDVARNKFLTNLDEPFTIEFWMKPSGTKPYTKLSEIINMGGDRGPGYRIYYFYRFIAMRSGEGTGKDKVFWDFKSNPTQNKISNDQWNHIAFVKTPEEILKLYVNGKLATTSETTLKVYPRPRYMMIGNYPGSAYPFEGIIDDIKFYRGNKSPSDILNDSRSAKSDLQVKMDGKLDDPFWQDAKEFGDFSIPPFGKKPQAQTKVKFKSDGNYLYFAISCDDQAISSLKVDAKENATIPVYRDDSVEIMLETEGSGAEYYHFLITPKGFKAQAIREQGGVIPVPWNNGNWLGASHIDKAGKKWTAEFAIPYNILNRTKLTPNSSFNVARNHRSISETEQSSLGSAYHDPAAFKKITLDKSALDKFGIRLSRPQITSKSQVSAGIKTIITTELTSVDKGELSIEGIVVNMKNPEIVLTDKIECQYSSDTKPLELQYMITEPGEYLFTLRVLQGKTITYVDITKLNIEFTLLSVNLLEPFYRDNIYSGQKIEKLNTKIDIGLTTAELKDHSLQLQLEYNGKVISNKIFSDIKSSGNYELPLPDNMADGAYKLTNSLLKSNKVIATTIKEIKKLPPAKGSQVIITSDGLTFNNKPILNVTWWGGSHISEIAKTGAFAVFIAPYGDLKAQLDEAEQNGMKLAIGIFGSVHAKLYANNRTKLEDDTKKYVTDLINKVKNHPALFYYNIADEPEARGCDINFYTEVYKLIRELDPYHPILICNNTTRGIYNFKEICDMFCPDPYLLPLTKGTVARPSKRPMSYLIDFMKEQKRASDGYRLSGLTLQTFNYATVTPIHGDTRAPTFIELRSAHYMGIVYGAKIFNYYKYGASIPGLNTGKSGSFQYPDLRIGTIAMIKELQSLETVLATGKKINESVVVNNNEIHLSALQYNNDYYIIAVNGTAKTESASFKFNEKIMTNQLRVISENRKIAIKDNVFQDTFVPFGVHIYTTNENSEDVILLEQLKKEIKEAGGLFAAEY